MQELEDVLLEPAAEACHCLTVSLTDLAHFSSELARLLLLQPRAVLRVLDASAVAAQASLLQHGALAATSGVVSLACTKAADLPEAWPDCDASRGMCRSRK